MLRSYGGFVVIRGGERGEPVCRAEPRSKRAALRRVDWVPIWHTDADALGRV